MRIGECLRLQTDCLRQPGPNSDHDDQWALHVPLGKLHCERRAPADDRIRQLAGRILALRGNAPLTKPDSSSDWLLRKPDGRRVSYQRMWQALAEAAGRAGCSASVRPHQLRHYLRLTDGPPGNQPARSQGVARTPRYSHDHGVRPSHAKRSAARVSSGTPSPLPASSPCQTRR